MTAPENKSVTSKSAKIKSARYEVGYGRPPRHTQFQKGRSGNPSGRPSRATVERVKALALQAAYRRVIVMENGRAMPVTAIEAILRSQIELATQGNVQAQRAILATVRSIEKEYKQAAAIAAILNRTPGRSSHASENGACENDICAGEIDADKMKRGTGR